MSLMLTKRRLFVLLIWKLPSGFMLEHMRAVVCLQGFDDVEGVTIKKFHKEIWRERERPNNCLRNVSVCCFGLALLRET